MTIELNATHDAARKAWLASANAPDADFPIQNLPFGLFAEDSRTRGGVALGDMIIDLPALLDAGLLEGGAAEAAKAASGETLAPLLACAPDAVSTLRARLSDLFREGGPGDRDALERCLVPMQEAALLLPLKPTAFTDFCTSYDHIKRMGGGQTPRLAALALPVAYNGRASSVAPSGTPVVRPLGQYETAPGSNSVVFGPEPMLDFELEFGAWLRSGNALGAGLSMVQAEDAMFGCCLVNDWSARGIQSWESRPLGPVLGKSFMTSIAPWIVTSEALAPFRTAAQRREPGAPALFPHLLDAADQESGNLDVAMSTSLVTPRMREEKAAPAVVVGSGLRASKLALPGSLVAALPGAEVVERLARPA